MQPDEHELRARAHEAVHEVLGERAVDLADICRPTLAARRRAGSRRPRRARSGVTHAPGRRTASRSPRRRVVRSPMPMRGAPGLAARNSASTCSSTRTRRSVRDAARPVGGRVVDRVPGEEVLALGGQLHAVHQAACVRPPDRGRPPPLDRFGEHALRGTSGTRCVAGGGRRSDGVAGVDAAQHAARRSASTTGRRTVYAAAGTLVSCCTACR